MCEKRIVRCPVFSITKCNVTEMFHTADAVTRIKIEHVLGMITSY